MILMQTKAIFIDAYRELNAKKLFWISLGLNLLAVAVFAALGINDKGVSFLHWQFDMPMNTNFISKELFYKFQFTTWGVPFWLSWITAILALISTAGIIPDMVSGGTIEPILSKPITRVRFFLTKYLTGLLFVGLQILVFSIGCILVLGIRAGSWEFNLLLAVPIVLVFFSYLFGFCAFVGLITRSTIAALLLTILFWSSIFVVNMGDTIMIAQREGKILEVEEYQEKIESQERFANKRIEQLEEQGKPVAGRDDQPLPDGAIDSLEAVNPTLKIARAQLVASEEGVELWSNWANRVYRIKWLLPKTQETIGLLKRNLISDDELEMLASGNENRRRNEDEPAMADPRVELRIEQALRGRTTLWVIGTSLIFEFFLVALSTLIFVRRDF